MITMKKFVAIIVLAGVAVFSAGCESKSTKTSTPAVQSTPTTEAPVYVPETTTTTVPVSDSCSKFVAAAYAWEAKQGSDYDTNGGFDAYLVVQQTLITLSTDWNAPNAAMFSARLALAGSGILEVSDTIHYCTVGQ